jgi:hypothetical protein
MRLTDANGTCAIGQTTFFNQTVANTNTTMHLTGGIDTRSHLRRMTRCLCSGDSVGAIAYRSDLTASLAPADLNVS